MCYFCVFVDLLFSLSLTKAYRRNIVFSTVCFIFLRAHLIVFCAITSRLFTSTFFFLTAPYSSFLSAYRTIRNITSAEMSEFGGNQADVQVKQHLYMQFMK